MGCYGSILYLCQETGFIWYSLIREKVRKGEREKRGRERDKEEERVRENADVDAAEKRERERLPLFPSFFPLFYKIK